MRKFFKRILGYIIKKCSTFIKNDELYSRTQYQLEMEKKLNLDNPITFNEKLQWLKLYYRNPLYTRLVDKYDVKNYVKTIIGKEYIIPTIGVWDKFEDIDFDILPNQFVLKCTHDSGGIVICKDKERLNIKKAKVIINKSLKTNFFYRHREYPYKDVKPRIIAEKYMVDEFGVELKDYKFFCFNGQVKFLFVASERFIDTKFDFFDTDFNHLSFLQGHPNSTKGITKPKDFEKMKSIATRLSAGIPQVRIDLYNINGKIYFGEYTFTHFAGLVPFVPDCWDKIIGDWLDISDLKK